MSSLKTFNTLGKTGIYEGVKRQKQGLSVSFNIIYEHNKQIVCSPRHLTIENIWGSVNLSDHPFIGYQHIKPTWSSV